MDTYIAHLGSMVQCWRNPFFTYTRRNGAEIRFKYGSVRDELGKAGGRFIGVKIFPRAAIEDCEALFELLVFLAIFCHDLGKLQLGWQEVMGGWQSMMCERFQGKPFGKHLLAHTDYDPDNPEQVKLYKSFKKRLPNHAVESACLAPEILMPILSPLLERGFGASREQVIYIIHTIVLASGRHHSAWAGGFKNKSIQLHPAAGETMGKAWDRLSRFLPSHFSLSAPRLSQSLYQIGEFDLNRFTEIHLPY
jgi:hypothetical protein